MQAARYTLSSQRHSHEFGMDCYLHRTLLTAGSPVRWVAQVFAATSTGHRGCSLTTRAPSMPRPYRCPADMVDYFVATGTQSVRQITVHPSKAHKPRATTMTRGRLNSGNEA